MCVMLLSVSTVNYVINKWPVSNQLALICFTSHQTEQEADVNIPVYVAIDYTTYLIVGFCFFWLANSSCLK